MSAVIARRVAAAAARSGLRRLQPAGSSALRTCRATLPVTRSLAPAQCAWRPLHVSTEAAQAEDEGATKFMKQELMDGVEAELPNLTDVNVSNASTRVYSDKVVDIAEKMLQLNMLEMADLVEVLKDRMDMPKDEMFFPMPNLAGLAIAAPAGDGDGGDAAPEAPKEEKTHFELKLVTFDAKAKIKIIKEVRAATKLGLKEAKELVESAPSVIMNDVKKDDVAELMAKLEELGATIALE